MIKEDLLQIETDDFILTFLGPKPSCNSFALNEYIGARLVTNQSYNEIINIQCTSGSGLVTILNVTSYIPKYTLDTVKYNVCTSYQDSEGISYLPLFYENIDYLVQLSPKRSLNDERKLTLWHEHSSIRKNLAYFNKHNTFLGSFNFRNNVGLSEFLLKEGEKPLLSIKFEVFSIKIGFLEDRYYMLKDLSKLKNNLIYKMFNPTKSEGINYDERASGLEWLVSFYNSSEKLIKIIKTIEKTAHNCLNKDRTICSINKLKKENKSLTKQICKYGRDQVFQNKNVNIEMRVSSYNTPENRYLKYLMKKLLITTKKWIKHIDMANYEAANTIKSEYIYVSIVSNIKRIEHIYNNDFWSKIDGNITNLENKTNFLFHNEFVQFEKHIRRINRAISLETKGSNLIYTLSMEDLYEIWTFCKLAQVIGGIVNNNTSNILSLKLKIDAFNTILKTGEASKIKVTEDITISTNRLFTTDISNTYFSPLVSQKPDLVFEIENRNILNILDAKYRIDISIVEEGVIKQIDYADLISENLSGKLIIIKHKDADINTIHRYKDAIQTYVKENGAMTLNKAVQRGIILYPYKPKRNETELIIDYLDKLDRFKIGSIPLAPGIEDSEWLNNSIDKEKLIFDDTLKYEQIRILANQVRKMIGEIN